MAFIRHEVKRQHIRWIASALTLFIACASGGEELDTVDSRPGAEDFSLIDLNGHSHRLSDYIGKVVLVSFWATWCPECVFEMPSLQALSNSFSDREFVVLTVNAGEKKQPVQLFADRHKLTFPILLDRDLATYKKWPVLGVPTSFVIDQQGKIIYSVVGAIEWTNPNTISTIRALTETN